MTTDLVPTCTDDLLAEIEAAAMAATPCQWSVEPGHYPSFIEIKGPSFPVSIVTSATNLDFSDYLKRTADADHMARCNPDNIRALLARLHAAEKDAGRYRWLTRQAWFQSAFDRYDIDDGGLQSIFERECAHIIDKSIQSEASK